MGRIGPQTEEDKKGRDFSLPPGRVALGATEFERKTSNTSGQDYVRVKWVLIHPKARVSKWFRATQSCDTSKPGAVSRWQWWMESLQITEQFELGSTVDGTHGEGDRNIQRLFMGRAVVAEIGRETSNGYTNNDIKKFIKRETWTADEREAIEQWELKYAAEQDEEEFDDDDASDPYAAADESELPPPVDDDAEFDAPPPPKTKASKSKKKDTDDDLIPW